ncbi:hypothetical protein BX265_8364 [Streptomyces sp. TLI_235]|nr:hypothetical protein BX265_8364 [Streptomyces sp. TLI_235]
MRKSFASPTPPRSTSETFRTVPLQVQHKGNTLAQVARELAAPAPATGEDTARTPSGPEGTPSPPAGPAGRTRCACS